MEEKGMSLREILVRAPHAQARVRGSQAYPNIKGRVDFYQTDLGVVVLAEMEGLPASEESCENKVFGFHIHEGGQCRGNEEDPFAEVGQHYNPQNCAHPGHAGDLPPIFGNKGYSIQMFITDRFTVEEILGKTIILHEKPDDFTTQPSGNAGEKIACGEIMLKTY